jgi:hypothetical protein
MRKMNNSSSSLKKLNKAPFLEFSSGKWEFDNKRSLSKDAQ